MTEKKYRLLVMIAILSAVLIAVALFFTILTFPRLPDDLNRIALNNPSYIIGENGDIVKILADREVVPLSSVSSHIQQAFLSLEDTRFYQHHGIDKKGLLRALINNLVRFRVREGASTITQQVAKALFFGYERKWSRKIKEAFIALQIERQFSKDRILEAYINQIDFGSGVYGVELAAQTYFGKHADELTLAESALIAGIPRWPARYNPATHADIAKDRQAFVLKRMVEEGYISEEQKSRALAEELKVDRINPLQGSAEYYVETVKSRVGGILGAEAVNYGGLRIHTAMDARLQYEASRAVAEGLTSLDEWMGLPPYQKATWVEKGNYPQAALVALDPFTGAVKALVGGRDFRRAPFNRALSNNRHAGSTFKPFIYFAVLDRGIADLKTVYVDEPVQFQIGSQSWAPDNIDKNHQGPVIVKYALMKSINTISAKLIDLIGPKTVVDYARRLGIDSDLQANMSLALGAAAVSPLEMAVAFATIANGGKRHQPYFIREIYSSDGRQLEEFFPRMQTVADPITCYLVTDILCGVVEGGTGMGVRSWGFTRPCAAKTGTSSEYRDTWFVGYTPELVAAVWVGFDDNRPMRDAKKRGITGARAALPIWSIFMKNALADAPYNDFAPPLGVVFETVDPRTGSGPMPGGPSLKVAMKDY